jgi:hypothetical protein
MRLYRPIALRGVQVGVAYAARLDLHHDVAGARLRHLDLLDSQRLVELTHYSGFHGLVHGSAPFG